MLTLKRYTPYYKQIFHLALPVVLAQAGQLTTQFADTAMVGNFGGNDPVPLAAVSLGSSLFCLKINRSWLRSTGKNFRPHWKRQQLILENWRSFAGKTVPIHEKKPLKYWIRSASSVLFAKALLLFQGRKRYPL